MLTWVIAIPFGMFLVIHEVAQSTVDHDGIERSSWNTSGVDFLHLRATLTELVNAVGTEFFRQIYGFGPKASPIRA
jgi:hypothetical protein